MSASSTRTIGIMHLTIMNPAFLDNVVKPRAYFYPFQMICALRKCDQSLENGRPVQISGAPFIKCSDINALV